MTTQCIAGYKADPFKPLHSKLLVCTFFQRVTRLSLGELVPKTLKTVLSINVVLQFVMDLKENKLNLKPTVALPITIRGED